MKQWNCYREDEYLGRVWADNAHDARQAALLHWGGRGIWVSEVV